MKDQDPGCGYYVFVLVLSVLFSAASLAASTWIVVQVLRWMAVL